MAVQKHSRKNQVTIPKKVRQVMGVLGDSELLIIVKDSLTLVLPNPKRYARHLQEICKGHLSGGLPEVRAVAVVGALCQVFFSFASNLTSFPLTQGRALNAQILALRRSVPQ
jgi:bifunctional DNA-binding transcriptional regulator/antitoxin component of YhaV-PrlF toxin-antitoxin module